MNATQYEQSLLMRLSHVSMTLENLRHQVVEVHDNRGSMDGKAYGQRLKLLETVMEWFLDEQTQLHSALGY